MKLIFCRELKRYSESDLNKILNLSDRLLYEKTIFELKTKKILVLRDDGRYSFEFVGVITVSNRVLFLLPKYVKGSDERLVAKQIFSLFNEYSKRENLDKEEIESIGSIYSSTEYNMLSVIIFLLNDYVENGLYSNEKNVFLFNGEDEIDWQKTLDEVQPILNNGEPIYLEYFTISTQNDEENYFRQLHKYVLSECSYKLNELGLSDFLGFEPVVFDVNEDGLGTPQSILSRIAIELNVQFINRKQLLLKAISSFILKEKMETDNFSISFYGTRSFNLVWEKTCSYILNNKYTSLKKLISKPKWKTMSGKVHEAKTLVPDIISIYKQSKKAFIIMDAKYYSIRLDDSQLSVNPGVEDITKQYLYQLAFSEYIQSEQFDIVLNCFLFPSDENKMVCIGSVALEFLKRLDLEDITLIKIPAYIVFDMYINSNKFDLGMFINLPLVQQK